MLDLSIEVRGQLDTLGVNQMFRLLDSLDIGVTFIPADCAATAFDADTGQRIGYLSELESYLSFETNILSGF